MYWQIRIECYPLECDTRAGPRPPLPASYAIDSATHLTFIAKPELRQGLKKCQVSYSRKLPFYLYHFIIPLLYPKAQNSLRVGRMTFPISPYPEPYIIHDCVKKSLEFLNR